jgi:septum formation protein
MIYKKLILASASPRRKEILENIGLVFEVFPSKIREIINNDIPIEQAIVNLAVDKALDVSKMFDDKCLIIAADTVVLLEDELIVGKPLDHEHALNTIMSLRDRWHSVITGISVVDSYENRIEKGFEKTNVKMRNYSKEEVLSYIKTGEPMDKAGGYGIQGKGSLLVEKIDGCYFNVVGLPINKLRDLLARFDYNLL